MVGSWGPGRARGRRMWGHDAGRWRKGLPFQALAQQLRARRLPGSAAVGVVALVLLAGGCIGVFESDQSVRVPDVVGEKGAQAINELCAAGLMPSPRKAPTPSERAAAGQGGWTTQEPWKNTDQLIVSTDPAAGATVSRNGTVELRYHAPHSEQVPLLSARCP